jgi:Ku70/Ku80 beta-barrel domain
MAPRANWKGFLRLSLVTCPVALYPATSESEKVSFNQLNRKTGHRIKYAKVDADTGTRPGQTRPSRWLQRLSRLEYSLRRAWLRPFKM